MSSIIPIFPLRTVLFPHTPLCINIFEERYKEMIDDCLRRRITFGVVALREGNESEDNVVLEEVGTLAKIACIEPSLSGGFLLMVTGATRFGVKELHRDKSYLQATVDFIGEDDELLKPYLLEKVLATFENYIQMPLPELPKHPELLSYLIAATLEVRLSTQQKLLECTTSTQRIIDELHIMNFEEHLAEQEILQTRTDPKQFSAN